MNSNRRKEVEKLKLQGMTPKQAYDATKTPKIIGKRKTKWNIYYTFY